MKREETTFADRSDMGPLEAAVYRAERAAASKFRRHHIAGPEASDPDAGDDENSQLFGHADEIAIGGFEAVRRHLATTVDDDVEERIIDRKLAPPMPGRIAARLLLARLFDSAPTVIGRILSETPVVIVDVPDDDLYNRVASSWKEVLGLDQLRFLDISKLSDETVRTGFGAISAVYDKPMMKSDRIAADARAYHAVQIALPIVAITPAAETHLSKVLLDAATDRLTLSGIDGR
ncbi:MAG TPA: hypothetical protein VFQ54_11405, partial [Thermomicrobiales bacterium]|nr:hypothetical protein [Thermomicrobiales bacterium]